MKKPKILLITGPAGAGKTTRARELCTRDDHIRWASWTTRTPRPGEHHDHDYRFVSDQEFDDALRRGDLLEHIVGPEGRRYGLPLPPPTGNEVTLVAIVSRVAARELPSRLVGYEVEIHRLTAPGHELEARMRQRGDSHDAVLARMAWSETE